MNSNIKGYSNVADNFIMFIILTCAQNVYVYVYIRVSRCVV